MAEATSYDLPNYIGELFEKSEKPNAFLRLVGGLSGSVAVVHHTEYPMGVDYSLDAASQPDILESAAPTPSQVATTQAQNVVQIFQEAIEFSYTRLATTDNISGVAIIPGGTVGPLVNPGTPEFQTRLKLQQIAKDMNYTFLRGSYVKPSDNVTSRQTRGVRTAVTTNLFANGGSARPMTVALFESSLRSMMAASAFSMGEELFVLGDEIQLGNLADLYKSDTRLPESREIVGVSTRTIVTQWATCHLVFEPDLAAGEILIVQPKFCRVVMLEIPGMGLIFQEPLAKDGSSEKRQVYSEAGIDYRHEIFHGVVDDLNLT